MEDDRQREKDSPPQKEMRVLDMIGCFVLFFGLLLLIPAATAMEVSERVTNLLSAIVLLVIGGAMFWRGVAGRRRAWVRPVVMFAVLMSISVVIALCVSVFTPKPRPKAPVEKATEKAAVSEKTAEPLDSGVADNRPEKEKDYPVLVAALRGVGFAMRRVVERIPLNWVKMLAALGFLLIAAVVWLVRRETVFEGTTDRKWWRDIRLWTVVVMATQIIVYLLLGT